MIYDNIGTNEYTELYPNPYVRQEMNRRIGNPRYVAMFYSIFDKHLRTIVDGINDPTKEVWTRSPTPSRQCSVSGGRGVTRTKIPWA